MNRHFKNMIKYKDLFLELVKKDIKLKYRNSYIGVLWSMLNPLLMMVVLSVIFSTLFKSSIENFPIYVLIGRLVYTLFSESTSFAMDSVLANSQLIKKVYVPKYFFPISRICSSFITNLISLVPIIIVMLVTGMEFSFYNLLIIVPIVFMFLICTGFGLIMATVNVFFRDIKHLYSVILLILMYATPIFYPESIIPDQYKFILYVNPMYPVLHMFRDSVMYNSILSEEDIIFSCVQAVICLIIGLAVFYKKQDRFIFYL